MNTRQEIGELLTEPEEDDNKVRDAARLQSANMDSTATSDLVHQLKTDTEPCRREAAKILGEIHEQSAAHDLVEALMDESIGVEWAAAEALIKYRRDAILPLLKGITRHFDSERFRRVAFHVLHTLDQRYQLSRQAKEVLEALHGAGSFASAAWAAEHAIEHLEFGN